MVKGLADFGAMPTHSIFLVVIYPIAGLILLRLSFGYDMLPVVFPLLAGFTLLGPLAAIGLYELSRRREAGIEPGWDALNVFSLLRARSIALLGLILTAIFLAWLTAAMVIYRSNFGEWVPPSISAFLGEVFGTAAGWRLIVIGCGVGFLFAVASFTISVVSFPMLVDRDVGVAAAVQTSYRAVVANPFVMAVWGFIVAAALLVGTLPVLIGLAVILPVLGHSTWHLYRKLVETAPGGR
ncbi:MULTISPECIES: DUF2189 domain-containing protein [Rhodomicrobium]|uniref:DUF2189 domain-containing protein n=1 Tax=Rhodomicrobium TaxID=1068 RepID=UPI001FDA8358|nr:MULTISPECIES: DUF2189 domain-containing protein [Rhodomicrobium]